MLKKQIITIIIAVVVVFGIIIGWGLVQILKMGPQEFGQEEQIQEIFSLSATVTEVDTENNFLIVQTANQGDVKIILSDDTQLTKLEFPFDPENPPTEGSFTPKKTEIEISGFEVGDSIFLKAKENIVGKNEINNIDFIQILP